MFKTISVMDGIKCPKCDHPIDDDEVEQLIDDREFLIETICSDCGQDVQLELMVKYEWA